MQDICVETLSQDHCTSLLIIEKSSMTLAHPLPVFIVLKFGFQNIQLMDHHQIIIQLYNVLVQAHWLTIGSNCHSQWHGGE